MNQNEYTFRRTAGAIGGTLLIFLLLITVLSILSSVCIVLFGMLEVPKLWGDLIYYTVYAAGYLTAFMLPVAFLKRFIRKRGLTWAPMQTKWRISPWWILAVPAGILIIFSASYINVVISALFDLLQPTFPLEDMGSYTTSLPMPYEWVIQFIVICLVPGFCEEFLFRGAILTNLLPFGRSRAILISAFLFSMMHQNLAQFFYTFVAGVVLGVLYERTGSIWPGTVLHICNNFASLGENILPYKANNVIQSLAWNSMFMAVLAMVGTVSLVILILRYFSGSRDFGGGVFGGTAGSTSISPAYPVAEDRWFKLFLTPSMIIFLLTCIPFIIIRLLGGM